MVDGNIRLLGWDVCDGRRFDKLAIASFAPTERDQAEAICKLMNSNEEVERGNDQRE
jgi:hypothetical protein